MASSERRRPPPTAGRAVRGGGRDDEGERDLAPEHPRPADHRRQQPADDRPDDGRDRAGREVEPERAPAVRALEARRDRGQADRQQRGAADALGDAAGEENLVRRRERARGRARGEDDRARGEDGPVPEPVAEPADREDRDRERQDVGVDGPRQRRLADPERVADDGQREVDDREVEVGGERRQHRDRDDRGRPRDGGRGTRRAHRRCTHRPVAGAHRAACTPASAASRIGPHSAPSTTACTSAARGRSPSARHGAVERVERGRDRRPGAAGRSGARGRASRSSAARSRARPGAGRAPPSTGAPSAGRSSRGPRRRCRAGRCRAWRARRPAAARTRWRPPCSAAGRRPCRRAADPDSSRNRSASGAHRWFRRRSESWPTCAIAGPQRVERERERHRVEVAVAQHPARTRCPRAGCRPSR